MDHAACRRRGPHHDRDALPKRGRDRRTQCRSQVGPEIVMSIAPQPPPQPEAPAPRECVLCDTELSPNEHRCPSCGLYQELGADRPNPFRQRALWLLIGALVAVYAVVLMIVAVVPKA